MSVWLPRTLLLAFLAQGLLGLWFVVKARRISEFLFSSADGRMDQVGSRGFQAVAFSVLGASLAAWALPGLARAAVQMFWLSRADARMERAEWLASESFHLLEVALQVGVGVGLFLGARALAGLWHGLHDND